MGIELLIERNLSFSFSVPYTNKGSHFETNLNCVLLDCMHPTNINGVPRMHYIPGIFLGWLIMDIQGGCIVVGRDMVRCPKSCEKNTLSCSGVHTIIIACL